MQNILGARLDRHVLFYDVPRDIGSNVAKHLSWGAVVPLGYVLIWTKRVGTSDQGVVLRVFLNRVFLCSVSLKRFEWSTCVVQKTFFSKKSCSMMLV